MHGPDRRKAEPGRSEADAGPLAWVRNCPTNRTIELHTAEHVRVDGSGKILEHQRYADTAALLAQLGAFSV